MPPNPFSLESKLHLIQGLKMLKLQAGFIKILVSNKTQEYFKATGVMTNNRVTDASCENCS